MNALPRASRFWVLSALWVAGFSLTLLKLCRYCWTEDLFSYVLLIPVIAAVLIFQRGHDLDLDFTPAPRLAAALGGVAILLLGASFQAGVADPVARLSLEVLAFVCGLNAIGVWSLGSRVMSGLAFPAGFLVFMSPLPPGMVDMIEVALQHASAEVAAWFFPLADVPFFRTGLSFQLPNITLQVAPECSGIRSTLVLFMTSLIAGSMFLTKTWQRVVLALLVIPLGIARNAFRITTLGWLCTNHGREMIDSVIHRRGGPVFFALSLVPLFALLILFRRMDKRDSDAAPVA
jgi:exosortase C (VPDSG-CTERM-specific)